MPTSVAIHAAKWDFEVNPFLYQNCHTSSTNPAIISQLVAIVTDLSASPLDEIYWLAIELLKEASSANIRARVKVNIPDQYK